MVATVETANVRRTVRRISADLPASRAAGLLDLAGLEEVPPARLARLLSVKELSEDLAGTAYAGAFERASHHLVEGEGLFAFEQTFELAVREELLAEAARVGGWHGRSAVRYMRLREQFDCLAWAARLRFSMGFEKDEARRYVPRPPGRAEREELERALGAGSLAETGAVVAEFTGRTIGGGHSRGGGAPESAGAIERALRSARASWARDELRRGLLEYSSLLAYFDVRGHEVRDICTAMAARRIGRPAEEVLRALGRAA
jgi:hypothetical protein